MIGWYTAVCDNLEQIGNGYTCTLYMILYNKGEDNMGDEWYIDRA